MRPAGGPAPAAAAVLLWGPPLAWAAVIFLSSSTADPSLRPPGPDTLLHFLAYAILAALSCRAFSNGLHRPIAPVAALFGAVSGILFGAADELHQRFVPGRSPEIADVAADAAGAVFAVVLLLACTRLRGGERGRGKSESRAETKPGDAGSDSRGTVQEKDRTARVTLYTRSDCHLCHDALGILERERQETPFELEVLDVDQDPALALRFGGQVPVVFIGGRKAFKFRVNPSQLRRRLARAEGSAR